MNEVLLRMGLIKIDLRATRLFVVAAFACVIAVQAPVVVAQDEFEIDIKDDLVWISAEAADLQQLLQQLADESHFKLWISGNLPQQTVTFNSEGKSIEDTLRRLLSDNSYALVYDDDTTISTLYVLPTGESQTTNLALKPSNGGSKQQILMDALQSEQVPDDIKAAMLDQFGSNPEILQQAVMAQRTDAVERLIEQLELVGSPSRETMEQLRLKLELELNKKAE